MAARHNEIRDLKHHKEDDINKTSQPLSAPWTQYRCKSTSTEDVDEVKFNLAKKMTIFSMASTPNKCVFQISGLDYLKSSTSLKEDPFLPFLK